MRCSFGKSLSIFAVAAALTACGGSGDGASGDGETSTGSLSLGLTDAPVDSLQSVFITFTGVSLKPADGEAIVFEFAEPKTLDLLTLQGGNAAGLLDDEPVAAGQYEWVRLDLSEQQGELYVIDNNSAQHPLSVPSGAQTGLKLVSGFIVPAGGSADFTIDFDVRKSMVDPRGRDGYLLKPALRLIDNVKAGAVSGTVDATTIIQTECADSQTYAGLVYLFEGADVVADDFGGLGPEALMAVPVADQDTNGTYTYKAAFLPEGEYTLAYTCDLDDMAADDNLSFIGKENLTVVAGDEIALDFE